MWTDRSPSSRSRDGGCSDPAKPRVCTRSANEGGHAATAAGSEMLRRHKCNRLPIGGPAEAVRLLQYRVEHRREVAGRGVDDLQHLGGRGLLLQRLARLGHQPRVLHRDDRLRREILQQRDLLVGERPDFPAVDRDDARAARHPCAAARSDRCGRRRARPCAPSTRSRVDSVVIRAVSAIWTNVSPPSSRASGDSRLAGRSHAARASVSNSAQRRAGHGVEALAVVSQQSAERGAAQPASPFPASRRTPARDRRARN